MERSMTGQTSWERILGAQATMPACLGQSVIAGSKQAWMPALPGCAPRMRFQVVCSTLFRRSVHYGAEAIYDVISRRAINLPACPRADACAASSAEGRKVSKRGQRTG